MRQAFTHQSALAEQSLAAIENPYSTIPAIRKLRRELGLTSNDLVTLQALISFLPKKDGKVSARIVIVFPSNASLSERTNGLDERTIRRCVCRLVSAGLISRRDSATRKRFPLRCHGVIRDAFGFDLAPMYQREAELKAWAERIEENTERLRLLRAKALALRVMVLKQIHDVDSVTFLTKARNILRRATTNSQDIINLIKRMNEMIGTELSPQQFPAGNPDHEALITDKVSATDGQNVRHVEHTRLNRKKGQKRTIIDNQNTPMKQRPEPKTWADFRNLSEFYPDEPKDMRSIVLIISSIGSMLKISREKLMYHLQSKGPKQLLKALDAIIAKATEIRHPPSYLEKMMKNAQ